MFSSQTDSLLRSFSRGPRKADPHSRVYNPPKDDAIIAQFASTAQGGVKGEFKNFFAPTSPHLGTDPTKPLILLAQIAICPESRPPLPRLRLPRRNPPPRTASRTPARLSAPLRALPRPSAPFRASSIAAVLFVSFRVSRRRALVSGARGGDKSRDALRRTGRDAVSSPRAMPRIKVAQQPASTRSAFVVARSAPIATRAGGEQIYRSQAPPSPAVGT